MPKQWQDWFEMMLFGRLTLLAVSLKRLSRFTLAMFLACMLLSTTAHAALLPFTEADLEQIYRSENFRDSEFRSLQCGSPSHNPTINNKVFFIGDSITVGMVDGGLLEDAREAGFDVDISFEKLPALHVDGEPRRKGPSVEAIGAYQSSNIQPYLAEHASDYADVGTIVVGLGTNRAVDIPQEQMIRYTEQFVDILRSNNSSARIFWVNVYRRDGREGNVNAALAEAEARSGGKFTVLDFALEARRNTDVYPLDDRVHHTTRGNEAKGQWILDQIGQETSAITSVSSQSTTSRLNTNEVIESLTEEQRIAQSLFVGFYDFQIEDMEAMVEKYKLGGVYILGEDNEGYNKPFFDGLNASLKTPLLVASDEEGGSIQRFRDEIGEFPSAKELGQSSDATVELTGKTIGEELLKRGVNTVLAPVADLSVQGSGAIFDLDRGFSDDPAVVKRKADAFAKGLRSAGVNPTYKHFPGLGTTPGNTDDEPQTSPNIDTLRSRDLLAFEDLILRHRGMVMLSNAKVPGLTEGNEVASTSGASVRLLRNELGYDGLILTDDLKADALVSQAPRDTVADALEAGVTMPLFKFTDEAELQGIIDEIKQREIDVRPNLFRIIEYKNDNIALTNNQNPCGNSYLTGDNEADVFRILVQDLGYTREQAAGVIANMRHESSVEPMRLQGTPRGFETPSSTVDIAATSGIGWGLVQWTPTGKIIQQSFIRAVPYDEIDTITYQLEFLDGQLRGEGIGGDVSSEKVRAGDPFFASTTVTEAASIFAVDYERCAACQSDSEEVRARIADAIDVLTKFGSQ